MSSIFENTIICRKCGYVRICFDGTIGYNGKLVPKEFRTGEIHRCDIGDPFECLRCQEKVYFDKKVLSVNGRRIAPFRTTIPENIMSVVERGLILKNKFVVPRVPTSTTFGAFLFYLFTLFQSLSWCIEIGYEKGSIVGTSSCTTNHRHWAKRREDCERY